MKPQYYSLANCEVTVVGATSGIGLAAARRMAALGATVTIASELKQPPSGILKSPVGRRLRFVSADVSKPQGLSKLKSSFSTPLAKNSHGTKMVRRCLVYNAGIFISEAQCKTARDYQRIWKRTNAVNLTGAHETVINFIHESLRLGYTDISVIITTSINATLSEADHIAYDTTKAALSGLVRSLAVQFGPKGVRVNGVAPGLILTPLTASVCSDLGLKNRIERTIPLRRIGTADECAGAFAFLASQEAIYISGTILGVDGGLSAAQATAYL